MEAASDELARRLTGCRSIDAFLAIWLEEKLLPAEQQRVLDAHYASYRRRFPERVRGHYASQTLELMAIVAERPGCRVLEVGSGCGTESLWMAMHGARVLGIDLRDDRLAVARARQALVERALGADLACRFERASFLELDREPFDVVWLEQAVHHLEPRARALDRVAELAAPGGFVVVSEANALNPLLQLQLLLRRGLATRAVYVDSEGRRHPYGNERVLRASVLERELARRGVQRVSLRYFRVFPNHPAFARLSRVEGALARPWLRPLLTHYNLVGRRA